MRFTKRFSVLLAVLLIVTAAVAGVSAQDDAMGDMVACDSDLILNLYIAEYYFGFGAYHEAMMMEEGDDMMMSVDLASIDKGQFAGLFDSMMMEEGSMMGMMSEETMNSMMEIAMMSEEEMMGMMEGMDDMMMLSPVEMMDEPEGCSTLRSELRDFYTLLAYSNMMMMDEG